MSDEFVTAVSRMVEGFKAIAETQRQMTETWQGLRGLLGVVDEHLRDRLMSFTPVEFNKVWDSLPERRKIEYVLSLIT